MRTLNEVQQEYTMLCAQLGDFEVKAGRFQEQLQAQRKQLLDKVAELDAEAVKIKEVQAELDKQKAEAAKEAQPVAAEAESKS